MRCPNCGAYRMAACRCTWSEMQQAAEILRRQEAEKRRKRGEQTVVEAEHERQRKEQPQ